MAQDDYRERLRSISYFDCPLLSVRRVSIGTQGNKTYYTPNNNKNNGYRISMEVGGGTGRAFSLP